MLNIACLLLASSFATAADPPAGPPLPKEIVKELDYFVGDWVMDGQMAYGPMKASVSVRWSPGRHCLIWTYRRVDPSAVVHGHGVWGWDSAAQEITTYSLYSDQSLEHCRGKPDPSGVWKGKYLASLAGKKVEADGELRKEGPEHWSYRVTGLADGGKRDAVVRFTRVKPAAPAADAATAEDYLAFWKKYFVGDWDTRGVEGEWKDGTGTWSCRPSPNDTCMYFAGTWNGKEDDRALAGYDPRTGSWKEVFFMANGDLITQYYKLPRSALVGTPRARPSRAGRRW